MPRGRPKLDETKKLDNQIARLEKKLIELKKKRGETRPIVMGAPIPPVEEGSVSKD